MVSSENKSAGQNAGPARTSTGSILLSLILAAPMRPLRTGGIIALLAGIVAVHAVNADLLPLGADVAAVPVEADPVVALVGGAPLRVSDLIAQAGKNAADASPETLVRAGYLDDAAQQLALAQAAEADGLADALEVRAALALARRRVLSEAYLDLAISQAVTEEAILAAYDAETADARASDRLNVSFIRASTEEGARTVRRRLSRGETFVRVANDRAVTSPSTGLVHPNALPSGMGALAESAPLGALIGPVKLEDGWVVFRVDARRRISRPSLEDREPVIRARLKAEAMAAAARRAEEMTKRDLSVPPPRPGSAMPGSAIPGTAKGADDGPRARLQ